MFDDEEGFNPFPGLRSFEEEEEYLFFGRENQTDELLRKLSTTRFLSVIGASGSGKSSLVKSGLLPALHGGYMASAGSHWQIASMRPGSDPIGNLADALATPGLLYEEAAEIPYAPIIHSTLRRSRNGLLEAVKQSNIGPKDNLLILVDQFEELFRFSRHERENSLGTRDSHSFINLLLEAVKQSERPIYVVLTMRSDFLGDCTEFRGLPQAINNGQYLIPRMTREEFKMAITGPIAVGGGKVSPHLVTRLLNDVGENQDQLPILQHALMRTWDYWERNSKDPNEEIGIPHYEAIGGMASALSLHAEEAYAELSNDEERRYCMMLFKALTDKGTDGRGTRRPSKLKEVVKLTDASQAVIVKIIDVFRAKGRSFLMPPLGVELTPNTVIDISHESLMRVWVRMIDWVDEEIESAEIYLRLAEGARLHQEGKSGEWRDPELSIAANWRNKSKPNAKWAERYDIAFDRAIAFLDHSLQLDAFQKAELEKRQKKRIRGFKITAILIALVALIAFGFGINSYFLKEAAEIAQKAAEDSKEKADSTLVELGIAIDKMDTLRQNAEDSAAVYKGLRDKAVEQRKEIEEQAEDLIEAIRIAKYNEDKATEAQLRAEAAKIEAILSKCQADEDAYYAELAEASAIKSRNKALRLQKLTEARNMANKVVRDLNDEFTDSLGQRAIDAYELNDSVDGPEMNKDVYMALHEALFAENRKVFSVSRHSNSVRAIAINQGDSAMFSGDDNGRIVFYKFVGDQLKPTSTLQVQGNGKVRDIAYSKADDVLVIGCFENKEGGLHIYDLKTGKWLDQIFHRELPGGVKSLGFIKVAGEERLLFISGSSVYIAKKKMADLKTAADFVISSLPGVSKLAIRADGQGFYAGVDSSLYSYDFKSNADINAAMSNPIVKELGDSVCEITCSPNGYYVAIGFESGKLAIGYSTEIGGELSFTSSVQIHRSRITGLAIEQDNGRTLLATCGLDKTVKLIDLEDHFRLREGEWSASKPAEDILEMEGHTNFVMDVAFAPNGKYLISASVDTRVNIWAVHALTLKERIDKIINPAP